MATLIKKVRIIDPQAQLDLIDDCFIGPTGIEIAPVRVPSACMVLQGRNLVLVPGLIDLHVHFREPGFLHKEEIKTGIQAALAGGVTSALVMPNTAPVIDRVSQVDYQMKRSKRSGFDLMVAAAASIDQLGHKSSDIQALARAGVKAISDDGKAIINNALMEELLRSCRRYDMLFMQHAEDCSLSHQAALHEGIISRRLGLLGQPHEAEFSVIARDLALVERIRARYHALHISSAESLKLIQKAKRKKIPVSCEVSPHHLLLSEHDALFLDTNKKMNPPLRSSADRDALLHGIEDGSIDAVASDHAPHSRREKQLPFARAPFGVVGVETAILALLTLVKRGHISLTRAIALMSSGPARILQDQERVGTMVGPKALKNACMLDVNFRQVISNKSLHGRSKNSAFLGMELYGRIIGTFLNGHMVYKARGI